MVHSIRVGGHLTIGANHLVSYLLDFELVFEYDGGVDDEFIAEWRFSERELAESVLRDHAEIARLQARMRRGVAELDSRGTATATMGYRCTAEFLAAGLNITSREAKAVVAESVEPMPVVAEAAAEGVVHGGQVREIHRVLSQAPAELPAVELRETEKTLVELAQHACPATIRRVGKRLLAYWDQDGVPPSVQEHRAGYPSREFRYHYDRDGQFRFAGELDPETGQKLEALFMPLAKPDPGSDGEPDPRTVAERHGHALAAIIDTASAAPEIPTAARESAVVTVTVPFTSLQSKTDNLWLDGHGPTSASELRRWACGDAKIIPALLGSHSETLDVGRAVRHATTAQR